MWMFCCSLVVIILEQSCREASRKIQTLQPKFFPNFGQNVSMWIKYTVMKNSSFTWNKMLEQCYYNSNIKGFYYKVSVPVFIQTHWTRNTDLTLGTVHLSPCVSLSMKTKGKLRLWPAWFTIYLTMRCISLCV